MSFSDSRRNGAEGKAMEESKFHERDFKAGCPSSAEDIHWNSSFIQPSKTPRGKGRRCLLHLLADFNTHYEDTILNQK